MQEKNNKTSKNCSGGEDRAFWSPVQTSGPNEEGRQKMQNPSLGGFAITGERRPTAIPQLHLQQGIGYQPGRVERIGPQSEIGETGGLERALLRSRPTPESVRQAARPQLLRDSFADHIEIVSRVSRTVKLIVRCEAADAHLANVLSEFRQATAGDPLGMAYELAYEARGSYMLRSTVLGSPRSHSASTASDTIRLYFSRSVSHHRRVIACGPNVIASRLGRAAR